MNMNVKQAYVSVIINLSLLFFSASGVQAQNTILGASTFAGQTRPTGDGSLAGQAVLNRPAGLCYDAAGNLYIADLYNYRVRKVDASGRISTVAGTGTFGYTGDNGPATSALIGTPKALALDTAGNLYISDTNFQVVRKVATNGTITTVAGNGNTGSSGIGGPATSASLNGPGGLAVDSSGNIYIADTNNNRVLKVSNGTISIYAGNGKNSLSATAGTATTLPLSSPAGLVLDAAGNLYAASVNYASIMKITPGGIMSLFAGYGYDGQSDGVCNE